MVKKMFLPTTSAELKKLKWDKLDVILVTGDAYIDSPFIGVSLIGNVLTNAGFRVGIIAQPDISSDIDICRLGEPGLFWGDHRRLHGFSGCQLYGNEEKKVD